MFKFPLPVILLFSLPLTLFASSAATAVEPDVEWRWLGLQPSPADDCPKPIGDWETESVFKNAPASSQLKAYCSYRFIGGQEVTPADTTALQSMIQSGDLLEVGRDLMALGSAGQGVHESLWLPLAQYFLDQAGGGRLPPVAGNPPVRLAVLDTHPTAETLPLQLPANSNHGATLIAMAERLLCGVETFPGAPCIAQVTSRLALSYLSYSPIDPSESIRDTERGGYVGTLGELAEAIDSEVAAWGNSAPTGQGLILNLSIGWNPEFGGLEPNVVDMPLAPRMVYEAIVDAACRGAIVMAAAGNRSGGSKAGTGAMLPAAWANRALPLGPGCQPADGDPYGGQTATAQPQPMVYAVGGVQGNGHPLTNARPESMPERVALGDHGVVPAFDPTRPTSILTGSSVATVVASAAAASAWYYIPAASPIAAMAAVDAGGDALHFSADLCFSDPANCPQVRRVSACRAAQTSCALSGSSCPDFSCSAWNPQSPDLSGSRQHVAPQHVRSLNDIDALIPDPTVCEPLVAYFDPADGAPQVPCPDVQFESVESTPWVHPQPGTHTCPPCRIDLTNKQLIIEIDDDVTGTLSDPTLEVCGSSYSLGDIPLDAGSVTVVEDVEASGCTEATVSFTVTEDNSTYSSINSALIFD